MRSLRGIWQDYVYVSFHLFVHSLDFSFQYCSFANSKSTNTTNIELTDLMTCKFNSKMQLLYTTNWILPNAIIMNMWLFRIFFTFRRFNLFFKVNHIALRFISLFRNKANVLSRIRSKFTEFWAKNTKFYYTNIFGWYKLVRRMVQTLSTETKTTLFWKTKVTFPNKICIKNYAP